MDQRAQRGDGLGGVVDRVHLVGVGDVGLDEADLAAELVHHRVAALFVQVGDDHADAALDQAARAGQAQAGSTAGDDGGHVFEFHGCLLEESHWVPASAGTTQGLMRVLTGAR
ncbi:hypothetical protein D9M72_460740 [compost metagenome]